MERDGVRGGGARLGVVIRRRWPLVDGAEVPSQVRTVIVLRGVGISDWGAAGLDGGIRGGAWVEA